MKVLFENCKIYNSVEKDFYRGSLCVADGLISYVGADDGIKIESGTAVDLCGAYLVPGFIDAHTHGRAGGDFVTADEKLLSHMIDSYVESGVTGIMATLASATLDELYSAIERIRALDGANARAVLGIHLEGRYLNPRYRGAHAERLLSGLDCAELAEIISKMKNVGHAHVSAALELDGNGEFTKTAVNMGATVGIGHTAATYDEAMTAFSMGAGSLTHTFNAMPPLHHRGGGVIAAGMNNDAVFCELIADGFHVSPEMVKLLYRVKGDRVVLISDSMEATGCADGEYSIAGLPVTVKDGKARTHEGAIAGSTLSLIDGVKNLASFAEIPFEKAIYNATAAPAKMLGLYNSIGSLDVGKRANMLVLDKNFDVVQVILDGESIK